MYNCNVNHVLKSSPQFKYMLFIHSLAFFIICAYITNSQNDQLSVGLIAQLIERCTGIEEVMGSNPIDALISLRKLYNCENQSCFIVSVLANYFSFCKYLHVKLLLLCTSYIQRAQQCLYSVSKGKLLLCKSARQVIK